MKRLAFPVVDGKLATHFGHCEKFVLIDLDDENTMNTEREVESPPHQPGILPGWLKEKGATTIVAGGMGRRAQNLFAKEGIEVIVGAPAKDPHSLAELYIQGKLASGKNLCDH